MTLAHDALQQLARRDPGAIVVQVPQGSERVDHGVIGGQRVGRDPAHIPPAPVLDMELEEIVVAASEERRPQRADERELVARVVDRAQCHQEVANFARRVHERAGLGPVRDALCFECTLEERQRRTRGQQDAHVAQLRVAPLNRVVTRAAIGTVTDLPAFVDRSTDRGGNAHGFTFAELTRAQPLLVTLGTEEQHTRTARRGRAGPRAGSNRAAIPLPAG